MIAHPPVPARFKSPRLAGRLGLLAALALAASAPADEVHVGAHVGVDVHANVDVHVPAPVVAIPAPVVHVPVPVVAVPAPPPPPPPVVVHTVRYLGDLSCEGSVYYQVRSSAWVTHESGDLHLEFPARIRTGDYPCHIAIAGFGEFNAAPHSEFLVTPGAGSLYDLRIFRGGVRYAVSSRATLRVSSAFGLGACVNAVRATSVHPYRGRAVIYGEDSLQLVNLDGDLAFEREGRRLREVSAGHGLRISLAAARERSDVREVVYHDVDAYDSSDAYSRDDYYDHSATYEKSASVSRGKSSRKIKSTYSEETEYREDTHANQRGKGHYEHGNGKGLGHYKERGGDTEETFSTQTYYEKSVEKEHGKALGKYKERKEEHGKAKANFVKGYEKEHGKPQVQYKEHGNGGNGGNGHGNGKGKGKHGK